MVVDSSGDIIPTEPEIIDIVKYVDIVLSIPHGYN